MADTTTPSNSSTPSSPPSPSKATVQTAENDPTAASNLAVQADAGAAGDHKVNDGAPEGEKPKTGPVVALHAVVHSGKPFMPGETLDGDGHEDWAKHRSDLLAARMVAEPDDAKDGLETANKARAHARAESGQ